jgi:hypothetical protein
MNAIAERKDTAPVAAQQQAGIVSMIERLACNPDVDVEKFERLVRLQFDMEDKQEEREAKRKAEQARVAYCAAFAKMQAAIPAVIRDKMNTHTKQKYATLDAIMEALRKPLGEHGFSLSHMPRQTEKEITVETVLRHKDGHSESQSFTLPFDTAGSKTVVQAIGSSSTYAARYGTCRMLGIATENEDDDGEAATAKKTVTPVQAEAISQLVMKADEAKRINFTERYGAALNVPMTDFTYVCAMLKSKPKSGGGDAASA